MAAAMTGARRVSCASLRVVTMRAEASPKPVAQTVTGADHSCLQAVQVMWP